MPESELHPGRATAEGTRRFAARFPALPGHFRRPDRLTLSSLGLGTKLGAPGGVDDLLVPLRGAAPARGRRERVRHLDLVPPHDQRARARPRAAPRVRREARDARRGVRDLEVRLPVGGRRERDRGPPLPDPHLRRHRIVDVNDVVNGVHVLSPELRRGPDRAQPAQPRARDDRPVPARGSRADARGLRTDAVQGSARAAVRDARGRGRARRDRRVRARDLARALAPVLGARPPLDHGRVPDRGRRRRTRPPPARHRAAVQRGARRGQGARVAVRPGLDRRDAVRHAARHRHRRVHRAAAGAGPRDARAAGCSSAGVPRSSRPTHNGVCSSRAARRA